MTLLLMARFVLLAALAAIVAVYLWEEVQARD
jgi:hypothetical protein